jgi:hypothetical protein
MTMSLKKSLTMTETTMTKTTMLMLMMKMMKNFLWQPLKLWLFFF